MSLALYVWILMEYTLRLLSSEGVIIPAFPKFSRVGVKSYFAWLYVILALVNYYFVLSTSEQFNILLI